MRDDVILAVIPARYESSRFPGKPLCLIQGKPMIQWVYEGTTRCTSLHTTIVATDDERIAECVSGFGGRVQMTSRSHQTGTDRAAEVARSFPDANIIVNVQGDLPLISTSAIEALIRPFAEADTPEMSTLACPFESEAREADPNAVKVVCDVGGNALYFSRACIPFRRNSIPVPTYHHVGLYAFQASFLQRFTQLPATPLEQCESLEQLRVLEHGYRIRVSVIPSAMPEVNTLEDLASINSILTSPATRSVMQ